MTIRNFLELSTAHLDEAARDFLDQEIDWHDYPSAGVFPMGPGDGWLVWLPDATILEAHMGSLAQWTDVDAKGLEPLGSLPVVMHYAASLGVFYVWLAPDADTIDALPTFDW